MKTTAAALLLLSLASCSMSRHVQKSEIKTQEEVSAQTVTQTHAEDKSVTTVTAHADTNIVVPSVNVQSESIGVETKTIVNGDTLTAAYDKQTNSIKAVYVSKPKPVKVKISTKTEIASNVVQDVLHKTDSTGIKKTEQSQKEVVQKTSWFWLYFVILVVVIIGLYLLNRKFAWLKLPF